MGSSRLVLASGSPRRTALLSEWGIPHRVVISEANEDHDGSLSAGALSELLARRKARAVASTLQPGVEPILAADTLVTCRERHLGKPHDAEDAQSILMSISGQDIEVTTGVVLIQSGRELASHDVSLLRMRPFSADEAAAYVATGEPMDKAGAFAVQGQGSALIADLRGSFSNVVGLPRRVVFELLAEAESAQ